MTHPLCCPSLRLPAGTVSMVAGASETKAEERDGTQIPVPRWFPHQNFVEVVIMDPLLEVLPFHKSPPVASQNAKSSQPPWSISYEKVMCSLRTWKVRFQ